MKDDSVNYAACKTAVSSSENVANFSNGEELSRNPYKKLVLDTINIGDELYTFYNINKFGEENIQALPYCIRILLESCIRSCDNLSIRKVDVETVLNWLESSKNCKEINYKPSRVLLQDFTGVPALVDLASMRDKMVELGKDPLLVNPKCPVDLVIDHSIQVDYAKTVDSLRRNEEKEYDRNYERFQFLKWGGQSFENMKIIPPGTGIVHQVNLEYLARGVFLANNSTNENSGNLVYCDSLVGTDSHTTMINGLGILGWGVGGIEAESVMMGEPISMLLPLVVGFHLTNSLQKEVTATDLVLKIVQMLRKHGVVGKFVEFFGTGCKTLSIEDRATISNMSPEYGATIGYFPCDNNTIDYMVKTGRSSKLVKLMEKYWKCQNMYVDYDSDSKVKYSELLHLDLSTVVATIAGPQRPDDRINIQDLNQDFQNCFNLNGGPKSFNKLYDSQKYSLCGELIGDGSVVISAITSCTNTSNPTVMIAAGLLAKKAVEYNLLIPNYVKTSLSPGSEVVYQYLKLSNLLNFLEKLGYYIAGYGCMTCIGNSGNLQTQELSDLIVEKNLIVASVLSGNRNFEGRIHPLTKANYLTSPPLCIVYALAGTVMIDISKDPIQYSNLLKKNIYLKDLWPSLDEINYYIDTYIKKELFVNSYQNVQTRKEKWNNLPVCKSTLYKWNQNSTYIQNPPYFNSLTFNKLKNSEQYAIKEIKNAYLLLYLGDYVTTDHISPAGSISPTSDAALYLVSRGVKKLDFNTYGARRGNDLIMERGTFGNIRICNLMLKNSSQHCVGPYALHVPSNQIQSVYQTSILYRQQNTPMIVVAGESYGCGSSRDWAAKGPYLLGVKCVIAKSFERIHRSNLIGMGVLPVEFFPNENLTNLKIDPKSCFSIDLSNLYKEANAKVTVTANNCVFYAKSRLDTPIEIEYFKHGGILNYVLARNMV